MHGTTADTRRGSLHLGRVIASAVCAAALALPGANALAQSPAPETSPSGTMFMSQHFPYTLELPPGWAVVAASQAAGSDLDLFQAPGASARVGGGPIEDEQQTVRDRVEINRAEMISSGSCTSDPAMDRATTLGGAEAILWSWTCPGSHHVAINTIHDGLRLRLQVNVPADALAEAEPQLEMLRVGFRFLGASTASPDPDALAAVDDALQGLWINEPHPVELVFATLEARGLDDRGDAGFWEAMESATTAQSGVRFQDGEIIQYGAVDGGPLEVGWIGTYRLLDDRTIEATETTMFNRIVYVFTLQDDILTIDVVSNADPVDLVPQTAIYETLPFKRVP